MALKAPISGLSAMRQTPPGALLAGPRQKGCLEDLVTLNRTCWNRVRTADSLKSQSPQNKPLGPGDSEWGTDLSREAKE